MVSSITASLKVSLIGDGSGDAEAERACPFPRAYCVVPEEEVVCRADGRDPPPVAVEVDVDGVGAPPKLTRGWRCCCGLR